MADSAQTSSPVRMKTVCIIGAGPGGLVSAKVLHETKQFDVTIYEKKARVGGIWALGQRSNDGFLSPYTPTNLSRFTVGFSDLDWNDVDCGPVAGEQGKSAKVPGQPPPIFPKAWMASRYLETFRQRYIPDGAIQLGKTATKVRRTGEKWMITTQDDNAGEETRDFDYLVMAPGFFASPRQLAHNVPGLSDATPLIEIIHSSSFRRLDTLLPHNIDLAGKKILIIGGGNSSGEAAAAVAMQLSDAQWSPDPRLRERYRGCKVVHVTPRPFYPLPGFIEYAGGSRSYVPVDLKLYDFSRRPKGQGSYAGLQTVEVRNMVHGLMQTIVGGDQSDISPALVAPEGGHRGSAYVALTETYSEFARCGLIDAVGGRVTGLDFNAQHLACATIQKHGEDLKVDGIAAVVYSTGYTPCPALEILDDEGKVAIQYDPTSLRLPAILEQWQTMSRDAPNISFVGFYEGPYWGVMEMQARLTAHRWLTGDLAPRNSYETPDQLLKVRQALEDRVSGAPQFWFSDYFGYLEDVSGYLGLRRNHNGFMEREGTTSPARFVPEHGDASQATAIMKDLHSVWSLCHNDGLFTARAAFRSLQGDWIIDRRIESATSTCPSGKLRGTASFHPRVPTADRSGKAFDLEYLYIESGEFTASTGFTMTARRRYVYRYSENDDKLSVWFVKPENDLAVDYLFHNLDFVKPAEARQKGALVAEADHLCAEDMYETTYRLPMKGVSLVQFEVSHQVKGPKKNYVATTSYSRPPKDST